MSLIQEALRRRDADMGQPAPAATPAPPALPPPPPPPFRAKRDYLLIVLVVFLLALLGYGGWRFFLRPAPNATASATAAIPAVPAPPPAAPARPHTNLVAQAKAKLETTLTPERLELVMGVTNATAKSPAPPTAITQPQTPATKPPPAAMAHAAAPMTSPPPTAKAAVPAQPATVSAMPPAAPASKSLPQQATWPRLNITGIMSRAGGETVAFVNGQLLRKGESIAGARVLIVTDSIVQMVFQGETNFFRVGKGPE